MKGRTKFFNYFIACIATLSLATFAACSDDDPETPSGKLVLTASASSFVAGEGNVTFMVTYDGEDVTSTVLNVLLMVLWITDMSCRI